MLTHPAILPRYIDRTMYQTLGIADRMRAYLVLRSTPTRPKTLAKVSGGTAAGASLGADIQNGYVMRCSLGHYYATKRGRLAFRERLPAALFGEGTDA